MTRLPWSAWTFGGVASLATILVGVRHATPAQEVWQADIRVRSMEVLPARSVAPTARGGQLTTRIVITSDNDDDARAARLEILLPVGVSVLRLPGGCKSSPSAVAGLTARVTCDLGDVPVRGLRDVSIVTTGVQASPQGRFGAFVTSDTPDPIPSNNYAERALP
jgi:hypothetical protein